MAQTLGGIGGIGGWPSKKMCSSNFWHHSDKHLYHLLTFSCCCWGNSLDLFYNLFYKAHIYIYDLFLICYRYLFLFFLSFGFAVGPGVCWSVGMVELRPEISWATSKAVPGRHGDLHRGTTTEEDLRGSKKRSKIMKIWGNHENILKHTVEHTVDYSRLQ